MTVSVDNQRQDYRTDSLRRREDIGANQMQPPLVTLQSAEQYVWHDDT